MTLRVCFIVALSQSVLAGCVTAYVAPTSGKLATMLVQNQTRGVLTPYTFANAQTCRGTQRLLKRAAREGMFPGQSITVPIRGDQDFSLQVWADDPIASGDKGYCSILMTFTPEAGANYVASVLVDARDCHAQIFREIVDTTGQRSFVKEPSARFRNTKTSVIGRGQCRP